MYSIMFFIEILGTISFSISGSVVAMKKNMDILGVIVLGLITAVGGGIIRDVLIGQLPPKAFTDPSYALIAIIVSILSFIVAGILIGHKTIKHSILWNNILLVSDSFGLGAFTIYGIRTVKDYIPDAGFMLLFSMGVITGVGGGILRDIFAGNMPFIFRKHIYATASIVGALCFLFIQKLGNDTIATISGLFTIVALRLLAAFFEWNLPRVNLSIENTSK